jgi:RimJ/RimL family protein N-acetyltransferase
VSQDFDYQPTLIGGLLRVQPLRETDFPELYAVAADPAIWEQHPARDRHERQVFEPYLRSLLSSREALVAIDRATGAVIGMSRFHGYSPARSEVEIGWTFLARSHWGGTYNGELKRLMLGHAFRTVTTVIFLVSPENVRSRRAVEKLGAIRSGWRPDGSGLTSIEYRITESASRESR